MVDFVVVRLTTLASSQDIRAFHGSYLNEKQNACMVNMKRTMIVLCFKKLEKIRFVIQIFLTGRSVSS